MKYLDEYRNAEDAHKLSRKIHEITTRPWVLMEICGGQTHSIVKFGIDALLPKELRLVHGPGCPVCVTPLEIIDRALAIAQLPDVIFCSFGDMLRVPGSEQDLFMAKANGADVRMVYSPLDALEIAKKNPKKKIVFFAVGFETTAPANAMAAYQAKQLNIKNFSILVSHVLVPPAMTSILSSPKNQVQGFLAAGHVCAVMGSTEYIPIAEKFNVPIVVTGFEPLDLLQGIYMCVKQLEEERHEVENQYARVVSDAGNKPAMNLMQEVFSITSRNWRGLGEIPQSGFNLSEKYSEFDAEKRFNIKPCETKESKECICGEILLGLKTPRHCPAFGTNCTLERPLGATMVSNEGACAAYYRYRRHEPIEKQECLA